MLWEGLTITLFIFLGRISLRFTGKDRSMYQIQVGHLEILLWCKEISLDLTRRIRILSAVVPRLDSGFNHYWVERKVEINFVTMPIPGMGSFYNINIPIPKLKYQWHGPFPIAVDRGKIDAISLIQSNFKSGFNTPGNLDVIARQGDHLVYFWREDYSPFAWHGPFNIPNSTESTGNPSFVQSNFGDIRHGNYE